MFIADAGILSDGKKLYFTEFAGCRWGYWGLASELSASETKDGMIANYFQSIVNGKNPYQFNYGAGLAVYSVRSDKKFPDMNQEGLSLFIKDESKEDFLPIQVKEEKQGKDAQIVNVGYREYDSSPMGVVMGRGDTIEEAVEIIYKALKGISLKGMYYRPKFDFLSTDYVSSVMNRVKFLQEKRLI
jgi:phosphoribosylamine-glycine ligase